MPWFEETGAVYQVQFLLMKDQVSVMIDTSGAGLHKRGYRANSVTAPIKETLAAAMVNLSRVRPDAHFIDPFCGSGTILIEAATYAMNIAPGLQRHFSAEGWNHVPSSVWKQERERAHALIRSDSKFEGFGYDIDGAAVSLALENAKKAGVIAHIHAQKRPLSEFRPDAPYGVVVCNPPYGERLLDTREAREIYTEMGKLFLPVHGWNYTIISPDESFEEFFGRPADKRRKLYNGMLKCQVFQYFKSTSSHSFQKGSRE